MRNMLTIKGVSWRHWRCYPIFIVKFKHVSHLFLVFLLLSLSMHLFVGLFAALSGTKNQSFLKFFTRKLFTRIRVEKNFNAEQNQNIIKKNSTAKNLLIFRSITFTKTAQFQNFDHIKTSQSISKWINWLLYEDFWNQMSPTKINTQRVVKIVTT